MARSNSGSALNPPSSSSGFVRTDEPDLEYGGCAGSSDERQPLVGAVSGNPHDIKTCRICLMEEDVSVGYVNPENPLISPCLCSGSTRYVHRKCLEQWRTTAGTTSMAYYRCEICHYKYEMRRLWWAALIRRRDVSALVFAVLASVLGLMLGYVPVIQAIMGTKRLAALTGPAWGAAIHLGNGLLLLGLLGFMWLAIEACIAGCGPVYVDPCPGPCYYMGGDCCGGGMSAEGCAGCAAGGGEECAAACGVVCLLLVAAAAVAGIAYLFFGCFTSLYARWCDSLGAADVLVENVGAPAIPYSRVRNALAAGRRESKQAAAAARSGEPGGQQGGVMRRRGGGGGGSGLWL